MSTAPSRIEDLVRRTAGSTGSVEAGDPWILFRPADVALPFDGWKLHISSRAATYEALLEVVVPLLVASKVHFKVARSSDFLERLNGGYDYPAGVGKAVAVYPRDHQVQSVGLALAEALRGHDGPRVLSDRQVSPDSPVYYRYGPMSPRAVTVDNEGNVHSPLIGPDGQVFEGDAALHYRQPDWVSDPFTGEAPSPDAAAAPDDSTASSLLGDRFRVISGIREAPAGNVYRAIDERTGAPVVVKQARPFVAEHEGFDAVLRLRNERRVLERLAGIPGVPQMIDHFLQGGDEFLACSNGGPTNLGTDVKTNGPFGLHTVGSRTLTGLARRLATSIIAFHERGVIMRDLTPSNILLNADGICIVDFGLSAYDGIYPAGGTPGYMPARQVRNDTPQPADDLHALGMVLLYAATGVHPLALDLADDSPRDRALQTISTRWGTRPDGVMGEVARLLDPNPMTAAAGLRALAHSAPSAPALLATPTPATHADAEHLTALLLDDLLAQTDRMLGFLDAGGVEGHDINVHGGLSGSGLELLQHLDADGAAERVERIASSIVAAAKRCDLPPGLFNGTTGVHVFHTHAAAAGLAEKTLPTTDTLLPADWKPTSSDLIAGSAGIAIGHLDLHRHTGYQAHLDVAARLLQPIMATAPSRLVEDLTDSDAPPAGTQPSLGAAHGLAGVALALLAFEDASGGVQNVATDACLDLLATSVPGLVSAAGAPGAATLAVSWCQGLVGVGQVLLRAGRQREDLGLVDLALSVAASCMTQLPRISAVGQCCGITGIGDFMLDVAEVDPAFSAAAYDVATHLLLRSGGSRQRPVFTDPSSDFRAASWARGTTGLLGFMRRLSNGGPGSLTMLGPVRTQTPTRRPLAA